MSIAHGSIDFSGGITTYGTAVAVTCDTGFTLSGGTKLECQHDGTWSDTVTCEIIGMICI